MRIAICALVAALIVLLLVFGILLDRKDTQYRHLYGLYVEASQKPPPTPPEDDARAIRNYQALAEQYKSMVDELYERGERFASGRGETESVPGDDPAGSQLWRTQ